ncbi:hypothetical protein CPB85DRAFT_1293963 [Mucidula mucida]|nr:hypothetical protein CPB85DRAFT_1293963 [Mucidula mucida]
MSLLVTIFVLVFLTELIPWLGKSVLLEICCSLYLKIFHPSQAARQRQLETNILNTKAELLKTNLDKLCGVVCRRLSIDSATQDSEIASVKSGCSIRFNSVL